MHQRSNFESIHLDLGNLDSLPLELILAVLAKLLPEKLIAWEEVNKRANIISQTSHKLWEQKFALHYPRVYQVKCTEVQSNGWRQLFKKIYKTECEYIESQLCEHALIKRKELAVQTPINTNNLSPGNKTGNREILAKIIRKLFSSAQEGDMTEFKQTIAILFTYESPLQLLDIKKNGTNTLLSYITKSSKSDEMLAKIYELYKPPIGDTYYNFYHHAVVPQNCIQDKINLHWALICRSETLPTFIEEMRITFYELQLAVMFSVPKETLFTLLKKMKKQGDLNNTYDGQGLLHYAFHYATQSGHIDVTDTTAVMEFLNEVAIRVLNLEPRSLTDIDLKMFDADSNYWSSLFFYAVQHNYYSAVKYLLDFDSKLISTYHSQKTALHYAAAKGHKEMIDLLMISGANIIDVDAPDKTFNYGSPLHYAVMSRQFEAIHALIEQGANINFADACGKTPLHFAVKYCDEPITAILLAAKADVTAVDNEGRTPFHYAIDNKLTSNHNIIIMQRLIDAGADIGAVTHDGHTPLHFVNNPESAELLLNAGKINPLTKITPLHIAAESPYPFLLKYLLAKQTVVDTQDADGKTPLHYATACKKFSAVKILITAKSDVNIADNQDETPLHYAVKTGNKAIIKLLLAAGANVNACNSKGQSPLNIAKDMDRPNIVMLLMHHIHKTIHHQSNTILPEPEKISFVSSLPPLTTQVKPDSPEFISPLLPESVASRYAASRTSLAESRKTATDNTINIHDYNLFCRLYNILVPTYIEATSEEKYLSFWNIPFSKHTYMAKAYANFGIALGTNNKNSIINAFKIFIICAMQNKNGNQFFHNKKTKTGENLVKLINEEEAKIAAGQLSLIKELTGMDVNSISYENLAHALLNDKDNMQEYAKSFIQAAIEKEAANMGGEAVREELTIRRF